jgi:hypothetical protein
MTALPSPLKRVMPKDRRLDYGRPLAMDEF